MSRRWDRNNNWKGPTVTAAKHKLGNVVARMRGCADLYQSDNKWGLLAQKGRPSSSQKGRPSSSQVFLWRQIVHMSDDTTTFTVSLNWWRLKSALWPENYSVKWNKIFIVPVSLCCSSVVKSYMCWLTLTLRGYNFHSLAVTAQVIGEKGRGMCHLCQPGLLCC